MRRRTWQGYCLLAILLILGSGSYAGEWNAWPFSVRTSADDYGRPQQTDVLGPIGSKRILESAEVFSIRPLYTRFDPETVPSHWHILYPLFNYYDQPRGHSWNSLNLLRGSRSPGHGVREVELFPVLFYRGSKRAEDSYLAVWPLGGTLKNRLFRDRIDFALWPLFVRTEKGDETRHHTPYPFVQRLSGPQSHGFGLWPLYGRFERENRYRHTWALWPLIYHYEDRLDEEVPYVRSGFLPFFTRESAEGLSSATYGWPFFGYTHESAPRPEYRETRYFWPFWIQGRGERKHVNRILPIYAHETSPGYRKNWYGWPLLRIEHDEYANMTTRTTSLFYFLFREKYHEMPERSARSSSFWPLYGYWNDGAGSRQFQLIDPFTVFFASNEKVRENWSPLFALYRYDSRDGSRRHNLLWNLFVYQANPDDTDKVQIGPLFQYENAGDEGHWQFLHGLFGIRRTEDGRRLRLFWNDL